MRGGRRVAPSRVRRRAGTWAGSRRTGRRARPVGACPWRCGHDVEAPVLAAAGMPYQVEEQAASLASALKALVLRLQDSARSAWSRSCSCSAHQCPGGDAQMAGCSPRRLRASRPTRRPVSLSSRRSLCWSWRSRRRRSRAPLAAVLPVTRPPQRLECDAEVPEPFEALLSSRLVPRLHPFPTSLDRDHSRGSAIDERGGRSLP